MKLHQLKTHKMCHTLFLSSDSYSTFRLLDYFVGDQNQAKTGPPNILLLFVPIRAIRGEQNRSKTGPSHASFSTVIWFY